MVSSKVNAGARRQSPLAFSASHRYQESRCQDYQSQDYQGQGYQSQDSQNATDYHEATKHSVLSVQLDPNYVDARTQPAAFKTYPRFFRRFPLDLDPNDLLDQSEAGCGSPVQQDFHTQLQVCQFLSLTSAITYQKQYRETTHLLRVQPSAGALYPTELMVQLRGVRGMIDGLYHLEPNTNSLTLVYELIDDGLEGYFEDTRLIKGIILLVSCVYFRSSWKYKNRSLRYCFLDSGHHLGAIEASAYGFNQAYQLLFDFDQLALNEDLGFASQEFTTAAIIMGTPKDKSIRRLRSPLPVVSGTDYFEPNPFIEAGYRQTVTPSLAPRNPMPASSLVQPLEQPCFPGEPDQWLRAIQQRRSARRFSGQAIDFDAFSSLCTALRQPIPSWSPEPLALYAIIHRVAGLSPGLYRLSGSPTPCSGERDALTLLKPGEFYTHTGHLCLDQAIARDCAIVYFFVAPCHNYRIALQLAGLLGHRLYLAATAVHLGCSGIGAFYDDEVQAFLGTQDAVVYAIAVGEEGGAGSGKS